MKEDNIFNMGDWSENDFNKLFENKIPLVFDCNSPIQKEVGDRVTISDYSSVTNLNGIELAPWDYDDFNDDDYYIVIADKQQNRYDSYFVVYMQDLVIVNPKNNIQYRVSSRHVKLFLNKKK